MIKKSLILCAVLVALVNCSNDKKDSVVKTVPSDTPTEIIDNKGNVVDVINPVEPQKPAPSVAELKKGAWTDIGFTKEFLMSELMGADICALGEKQYVGCFFGARDLVTLVYGEGTVLVVNGQKNDEFLGKKIKDLGPFTVYETKTPNVDVKNNAAVSAYNKRENDFFKETVKALVEQYKAKVAVTTLAQSMVNNYKVRFPEVSKKLAAAAAAKNKEDLAKARVELNVLVKDITDGKKALEASIFQDYTVLIDDAFEKIPEADRALKASQVYGNYLTHSADGHARLALHPRLEAMIASQAPEQSVFGIGVQVMANDEGIFMDPIEGSPAQAAGVQANDRLVSVNGQVFTTNIDEAVAAVKGARDTEVVVGVEAWGTKEQKTYTIKRAPIQQKSYTLFTKVVGGKTIGMLKVSTFMDDTMAAAVREFVKANDAAVEGWIMDLRGNPGGLVTQAVELSSVFLPKGSGVIASSTEDDVDTMDVKTMEYTTSEPVTQKELVVLINGRSASASEVVSGVLQEYKRAVVMGERSFGKGTMQRSGYEFHPDVPGYRVWDQFEIMQMTAIGPQAVNLLTFYKTVGRYFFPSGRTPEWVGVTPDVEVSVNPETVEMFSPREQDLIPFSFGDLGTPWVQTRSDLMTKIKSCVNTSGESVKTWSGVESKKPFVTNYQMLYAYDALKCI